MLQGTPAVDVIHGLAGQDEIHGAEGDDLICGGDGDDHLIGDTDRRLSCAATYNDRLSTCQQDDDSPVNPCGTP